MTAKSFNKIGWLTYVQQHVALSRKDLGLAIALCYRFTRRDGTGWLVELEELAAAVGPDVSGISGLSRSQVRVSLKRLCDAGVIVETQHVGGGRGSKARRAHDLVAPAVVDALEPQQETVRPGGRYESENRPVSQTELAPKPSAPAHKPSAPAHKPSLPAGRFPSVSADQEPQISPTGTSSGTTSGNYTAACAPAHEDTHSDSAVAADPPGTEIEHADVRLAHIAAELVRDELRGIPTKARGTIAHDVLAMLRDDGINQADIRAGLRLWRERADARPGLLPHLVADVVRGREARAIDVSVARPSTTDARVASVQALKRMPRQTEKILGGLNLASRLAAGQRFNSESLFAPSAGQLPPNDPNVIDAEVIEE